jgi:hypothetical protein
MNSGDRGEGQFFLRLVDAPVAPARHIPLDKTQDDDEKCPESFDRVVAPARAARPRGQGADDQNDENDKPHFGLFLGRPLARGRRKNAKFPLVFPTLRVLWQ